MANVALGKFIEERMRKNQSEATDGNITSYSGQKGFAEFSWPGYLTIDLSEPYTIYCIRILLWDGLGRNNTQRDNRIYKYRILTSSDHKLWDVLLDTGEEGYNGWQVIKLPMGLKIRYIRVHGLFNSANPYFQVVQVEAHDSEPLELDAETVFKKNISSQDVGINENDDGLPLAIKVRSLINKIENLIATNNILNPEPFNELIYQLREQVKDVASIEKSMGSIRHEIVNPVKDEINKLRKIGNLSFIVGIIGGVLAIIMLLLTIILPHWRH
jgi:hypothetical protein